jgi:RNA recognition motif-containing protein
VTTNRRRYSRSNSRSPSYERRRYERRRYRSPRRNSRRESYRGTEEQRSVSRVIFIANIPYAYTEKTLEDKFGPYGKIQSISMPRDKRSGHNKGFAFVEFKERKDAEAVFQAFNGQDMGGRTLRMDWDVGLNKKPGFNPPPPLPEEQHNNHDTSYERSKEKRDYS